MPAAEAAVVCECHAATVRKWVRKGLLRGKWPQGRGPGKTLLVNAADVKAFRDAADRGLTAREVFAEVQRLATA